MVISQAAAEQVLAAIRNGDTDYVKAFFDARPDWQDKPEQPQEKKEEAAQA